MRIPTRRPARLLAAAVLGTLLLTGCGGDNVECGLDSCTVQLQRDTDARVSVLGVEARFVSADRDTVTVEIAGEQVRLTSGQAATEVAGLQVAVERVNADGVTLRVSR